MICPYCFNQINSDLSKFPEQQRCRDEEHNFVYYCEINQFYLRIKSMEIGKDNMGHYIVMSLKNMDIIDIPPFKIEDSKLIMDRYLKLAAFS